MLQWIFKNIYRIQFTIRSEGITKLEINKTDYCKQTEHFPCTYYFTTLNYYLTKTNTNN